MIAAEVLVEVDRHAREDGIGDGVGLYHPPQLQGLQGGTIRRFAKMGGGQAGWHEGQAMDLAHKAAGVARNRVPQSALRPAPMTSSLGAALLVVHVK